MFLPKAFKPSHEQNRMKNEGGVLEARKHFIEHQPSNLKFLLQNRYEWMRAYLCGKNKVVELGAGAGWSKIILKDSPIILTDIEKYPWIDKVVDAVNLPFAPESVDAFVCSHMIHHVAYPSKFLRNMATCLKKDGVIVINEIYTSFLMKMLLLMMRHEGWDYGIDVFSNARPANNPGDPWSANCAIPELLWDDGDEFEKRIGCLKVELNQPCEFLIFALSGGVIAKTKTINLPFGALRVVHGLDNILVKWFPRFFALGKRVVLRRRES